MTQAYPLHWPDGWPRTKTPGGSKFKTTLAGALNNVQDSIRRFSDDSGHKVSNVVISSNVTLGVQRPKDTGVAVYFSWDGITTCIAVDRYTKVEDNLQAIHHVLEAERTKLRHGGLNIVRAAFRGYAALPPPSAGARSCWDVLGLDPSCTNEQVTARFRELAKRRHPDHGGSTEAMADLNRAYKEALAS